MQCGHAIIQASRKLLIPPDIEHPHLILCEVSPQKLHALPALLKTAGIRYALWQEPDRDNELTSICCEPVYGTQREFFKKFKLIKAPRENSGVIIHSMPSQA